MSSASRDPEYDWWQSTITQGRASRAAHAAPSRRSAGRVVSTVAALIWLSAAALATVGSLQTIYARRVTVDGELDYGWAYTGWTLLPLGRSEGADTATEAAAYGVPLVVTASLLLIASVLLVVAAIRRRGGLAGALLGLVSAAGLVGTVWTLGMYIAVLSTFRSDTASGVSRVEAANGWWLVLGAGALAVLGVVLGIVIVVRGTRRTKVSDSRTSLESYLNQGYAGRAVPVGPPAAAAPQPPAPQPPAPQPPTAPPAAQPGPPPVNYPQSAPQPAARPASYPQSAPQPVVYPEVPPPAQLQLPVEPPVLDAPRPRQPGYPQSPTAQD